MRKAICIAAVTAATATAQNPALVVLNKSAATADIITLADAKVIATMAVGDGPHEIAISPDGRWAVAANYGTGPAPGHTLTVLDLKNRRATTAIDMGVNLRPHGITFFPDGKQLAVTSEAARTVVIVDVPNARIARVISTGQPGHLMTLSKDGKWAWTANIASGTVSLVDVDRGVVVKTVTTGRGPEASDVTPDGKEFWAADRTLNYIRVMNATTLDSLATIPTGQFPNRLHFTPDGRWALVSNATSGTVDVIDAKARKVVESIPFKIDSARVNPTMLGRLNGTAQPLGILIAPDGSRAWVALAAQDQIAEIDLKTRKVTRYISTGREPDGMGYLSTVP